ncbi:MAG: hypothetical protein KME64_43565 [Scytonematopsis contorta HA4267-MV1]|nr:hypothetical protein [Scytonematopsis contorta HA4267-MV1]
MKFSVITLYPNSTSLQAANCPLGWESAAAEVEYLFMGIFSGSFWLGSQLNQQRIEESNHNYRDSIIGGLNASPKRNNRSGRYRKLDAVPI